MKLHAFAIAVAALALPVLASAQESTPTTGANQGQSANQAPGKGAKLSEGDIKAMSYLHHVNQTEINLAKMAEKEGSPEVKNYAKMLQSDHQNIDKDLQALAKAHKVSTIPAYKPTSEADQQENKTLTATAQHLKNLKGGEFNREFLNAMVSSHEQALAKLDTMMSSVENQDLKTMMQTVRPVFQRHLEQARDLQKTQSSAGGAPQPSGQPSTQPHR